jgi:hypothetical protein
MFTNQIIWNQKRNEYLLTVMFSGGTGKFLSGEGAIDYCSFEVLGGKVLHYLRSGFFFVL